MTAAPRRREQTRARLVEAASDLVDETGSVSWGVQDVCRRAGFTRGAFYSNFSDLEELLVAVWGERAEALVTHLEAEVAGRVAAGPLDLERAVADVVAVLPLRPAYAVARMSLLASAATSDAAREVVAEHQRVLRARLGPLLVAAVEGAGRRPTVEAGELADLLMAAVDGALLQAGVDGREPSAAVLAPARVVLLGASVPV
ncbi:TetR/AcrR family transcriptional regulator [Nocardioides bruguierae]|uniref:TetR/AcrR family transcriptional regulator n=1 Tax=Nocardioides bruguierae TaxID=2945102 RepID=A0A9X2D5L1_9ACTN|nr:TetR/AcrR family transcriptional regulator [Nocardioides bruguierae]MCM0618719.1 TetR/AcrR family transcriptional regulator [Nocardioides bruguierae]